MTVVMLSSEEAAKARAVGEAHRDSLTDEQADEIAWILNGAIENNARAAARTEEQAS